MNTNVYAPFTFVLVASLGIFLILMSMHETSNNKQPDIKITEHLVADTDVGTSYEEITPLLPSKKEGFWAQDSVEEQTRSRPTSGVKKSDNDFDESETKGTRRLSTRTPALSPQLVVIYAMFFIKRTGLLSLQIFTWQYISVRFQLRLAQLANLQVAGALSMAMMTIVILPLISTFAVRRFPIRSIRLDQTICVASASVFASGFVLIWAAKSLHAMYIGMVSRGN